MSGSTAQNSQTVNATTGQMPTPMASPAPQPQIPTDPSKNIPNSNPQEAGQVAPTTLNAVSPVPYTHLDVYKRQFRHYL